MWGTMGFEYFRRLKGSVVVFCIAFLLFVLSPTFQRLEYSVVFIIKDTSLCSQPLIFLLFVTYKTKKVFIYWFWPVYLSHHIFVNTILFSLSSLKMGNLAVYLSFDYLAGW